MAKNQVIYNQIGAFVGTVDAKNFHFSDSSGYLTNSIYCDLGAGLSGYSTNLVRSLSRIIQTSYSFNEPRIDVKSMGSFGNVARPNIISPSLSLNLSYYSMGLINEELLGFYISYGQNVTPISGFLDRTYNPSIFTDCKNIFVATNASYDDLNFINPIKQTLNGTTSRILKDNINVYSFGDCYLDSWKYSAAVGQIPQVDASFSATNMMYYAGGSGQNIPSVNPKDFTLRSGITYNLPPVFTGSSASVLLPGDIIINIEEVGGNNNIQNLPISFTDIKIQNFSIDLNLNRDSLSNLGYKAPIDHPINPPVFANGSFSAIVGDSNTGSLIDFIQKDINYNIDINLRYSRNQPVSGVGINFKFLKTKFNNIDISESISQRRICNFSFTSELNPNKIDDGFFISGQLGVYGYNQSNGGGGGRPGGNNNDAADGNAGYVTVSQFLQPSNFTLAGTGISSNRIDLTWTPSASRYSNVSYSLYRSINSGFTPTGGYKIIDNLNTLTYTDSGLSPDTTYYYYARSTDSNGVYTLSNEASGKTLFFPPTITSINPPTQNANTNFDLSIYGSNLTNYGSEYLSITKNGYSMLSSGTGLSFINSGQVIRSGLVLNTGIYSLSYSNRYGNSSLSNSLVVNNYPPYIATLNPSGINGSFSTGVLLVSGLYFTNVGGENFYLSGIIGDTGIITGYSINYINPTSLVVNISGNSIGLLGYLYNYYSSNYLNSNGISNSNVLFSNNYNTPTIITVDPSIITGISLVNSFLLNITGTYFTNIGDETFYLAGTVETSKVANAYSINYISPTNIKANISGASFHNPNPTSRTLITGIYGNNTLFQNFSTNYTNDVGSSNNNIIFQYPSLYVSCYTGFTNSAWNAFAKQAGPTVYGLTTSGNGQTGWVQCQFDIPYIVTSYSFFSSGLAQFPSDWKVLGSNDGSAWTLLDSRNIVTQGNVNGTNVYNITTNTGNSFSYYLFNITGGVGGHFGLSVSSIRLSGYSV